MTIPKKYSLFEVFGIEMEYMVCDKNTLQVLPIVDKLIFEKNKSVTSDVENGIIDWSNELVNHVIELKTHQPETNINSLIEPFHQNIIEINHLLAKHNATLLPTGAHPFMNPLTETVLWAHDNKEIYECYNRIFNCKGHGWSNLQSVHLNLPFANDEEFGRLHAACRILLPIIPALSASSPFIEGKRTGFTDTRLEIYRENQKKTPILTGKVIPERAFTEKEYYEKIFNPINEAISPFDPQHLLNHFFLNSRGAIARFDRGAIEIRIIDIQECPLADFAILEAFINVLKKLVNEHWISYEKQKEWNEDELANIFLKVIKEGNQTIMDNQAYLSLFNFQKKNCSIKELWEYLITEITPCISTEALNILRFINTQGNLSERIIKKYNATLPENIKSIYEELQKCLLTNTLFNLNER
jgi:gamma-glutamyl:cysteine ligase YbdK (ATP-grasp superfamily)